MLNCVASAQVVELQKRSFLCFPLELVLIGLVVCPSILAPVGPQRHHIGMVQQIQEAEEVGTKDNSGIVACPASWCSSMRFPGTEMILRNFMQPHNLLLHHTSMHSLALIKMIK